MNHVISKVANGIGLITLNRPEAINALSLDMVLRLSKILNEWAADSKIEAVAIRGTDKNGNFGNFCAGGDIRFFHKACIDESSDLGLFFTEEYKLNHLIFNYSKPYIAFMDGIVMGGGMGISQGASLRIVTERSKVAMPETNIGLFPDVGGGYFLPKCPGFIGEYLGLTGQVLTGQQSLAANLADYAVNSTKIEDLWDLIESDSGLASERIKKFYLRLEASSLNEDSAWITSEIDDAFQHKHLEQIITSLSKSDTKWAQKTLSLLSKRSPLMMNVSLKQIKMGRNMSLADELRLERTLVHHCFNTKHLDRYREKTETVEGIRALVIDKDNSPNWNPKTIREVTDAMVNPFFDSPWTESQHPLADLK